MRESGDWPAAHRHDHLASVGCMAHVPAQLIVQLTNTHLTLQI
jgi:hypothetical protein